ncbi:OLC1v1002041C1 [Oldenlandia corymbosa var. corymbosa]|uniref:OLC1v1002041C1 n=1 Tax=Oldenlandia corymbosa var. corymbosa TaxID=529605 RepID=A0AAV1D7D9_OLDCO|nr:OLC1v1002041C1 [Oldenlandia corymbosa var. corymbosa]
MALSYYPSSATTTNLGELEQLNSVFHHHDDPVLLEYLPDILGLSNDNYYQNSLINFPDSSSSSSSSYNNFIDPFFVPESHEYSISNYENDLSNTTLYSISPENEFQQFPTAKRQKGCDGDYLNSIWSCENDNGGVLPSLCSGNGVIGFDPNPPHPLLSPEIFPPFGFTGDNYPPVFSIGSGGGSDKGCGYGGSGSSISSGSKKLSTQSVAARQRRRKITEKTQELGKLIPGGQKMNTAEMFQAAYKYIKFLQAQVGVLESFASVDDHQENGETLFQCQELDSLLGSSIIQEKLYSMEKCLVPANFVQSIVDDNRIIQPNSCDLKDFKELIGGG